MVELMFDGSTHPCLCFARPYKCLFIKMKKTRRLHFFCICYKFWISSWWRICLLTAAAFSRWIGIYYLCWCFVEPCAFVDNLRQAPPPSLSKWDFRHTGVELSFVLYQNSHRIQWIRILCCDCDDVCDGIVQESHICGFVYIWVWLANQLPPGCSLPCG